MSESTIGKLANLGHSLQRLWVLLLLVPTLAFAQSNTDYQVMDALDIHQSLTHYHRYSGHIFTRNRLSHNGTISVSGQFRLVIENSSHTLANADGTTANGEPFVWIKKGRWIDFEPGERLRKRLFFIKHRNRRLDYSLRLEYRAHSEDQYQTVEPIRYKKQGHYYSWYKRAIITKNRLKNIGTTTHSGPFRLVVSNNNRPVANADGYTSAGEPYILLSNTQLAPRQAIKHIRVDFKGRYWHLYRLRYTLRLEKLSPDMDENTPPIADAGPDQTVALDTTVVLDGSASSDTDGDALSYVWSFNQQPEGSTSTLSDPSIANPDFITDVPGDYILELIVNDGTIASEPDQVLISTLNTPPVANAGSDQQGQITQRISLDGSASSDRDGDLLSYQWDIESAPEGSTAELENATTVMPAITLDRSGEYRIRLVVSDGEANSSPDIVVVTSENLAPIANAGPDQQAVVNDIIQLDGTASSDPEGQTLNYRWALINQPADSQANLSAADIANPTITIDRVGDYIVQLIVNDGTIDSIADQMIISSINSRPVANAGADQISPFNQAVLLSGQNSSDADNDELSYQWAIINRPENSTSQLSNANTVDAQFLPDLSGLYIIQLVVSDGLLESEPDTLRITVQEPPNQLPQITSTPVTEAVERLEYQYTVTATDPDNDPLSYTLLNAPAGMSIDGATINWVPAEPTTANVTVQVSDNRGGLATQSFTLTVALGQRPPVIDSNPVTSATVNTSYQYNLSASDPNGGAIHYRLSQAPLGMRLVQNPNNTATISWRPINNANAPVIVTVTDEQGLSSNQSFAIQVTGEQALSPTLTSIGNQIAPLGQALTLQLGATDPSGAAVQYMVEPTPLAANMAFDAFTGEFTFIPDGDQVGNYTLTFSVSNGIYTDQETITITVPESDGITRLSGQVLTEGDLPLPNTRLEINNQETFSDSNGNFLFDGITLSASGEVRLLVDGSTIDPALGDFATVPEVITLIEGADNVLTPAVYLLPLDTASADAVSPTQTSVVDSSMFDDANGEPLAPVTLTIPAGAAIDDATGEPFTGDIHISRVTDPDLGPRPLPEEYDFSVYIAVQPFGVTYPEPVPISFPNVEDFPPGSRMDFFALNHETGEMEKIGEGLVSDDGKTVDSIGGVVRSNSWHGITPQAPVTSAQGNTNNQSPQGNDSNCGACKINKTTGNLAEWHTLPSYRSLEQSRVIALEYNSNTTKPKPIFPMVNGFGNQAPPPTSMSTRIALSGINVTEDIFTGVRAVPSDIRGQFRLTRPSVQYDATGFETGLHRYAITTQCYFPISRRATTIRGEIAVHNQTNSSIGAGWAIRDLQRLYLSSTSGNVLLTDGTETNLTFERSSSTVFRSPPTDYSTLRRNSDGTYTRRMKDGMVYEFDTRGFLISGRDRNNNTTTYQYDSQDRLSRIIDPVGSAFELSYSAGKLASISDPLGRTTSFEHDSRGNLIAIVEPNGDRRTFEYRTDDYLMVAQTDQRGNRKQYVYDFGRRVKEAILPDDSRLSFTVGDMLGLPDPALGRGARFSPLPAPPLLEGIANRMSDQNGNITRTQVDDNDIPVSHTDAVGRLYRYVRDNDGEVTQHTRPNGSIINSTYDSRGNRLTRREEFNDALYRYTYNNFSLVTSYTNPNNNRTSYQRDSQGNATSIINALGHVTSLEYDSRGLVTRMETPNQLVVSYTYNEQGLLATMVETPPTANPQDIRTTRYTYDAAGQTTQVQTPDNITLTISYDSKGRITQVQDNLNQVIAYTYDEYNNLIQTDTKNSNGSLALQLQAAFDSRNRPIELSAPHQGDGQSTRETILDNNSNIIGVIDPNGNRSSSEYDREDRLTRYTHRLNGVTQYSYDTNDRITRVIAPNGVTTNYRYDAIGRITQEISPDRGTLSYTYDNNNNLLTMTDGRGITTTYTYDELERPISKRFPNSAGTIEDVSYCYDSADNCLGIIGTQQGAITSSCALSTGRLCAVQDESGTYVYDYDAFGNMLQQVKTELGTSYATAYQYDKGDNIIRMRYPTGRVVNISRDGVRRISAIDTTLNGRSQSVVSNILYRADNQMTQCTFGNGLTDQRSYDLQGRLLSQDLGSIDSRNYSYDPNSNMLGRDTTPQTSFYDYDALDRVTADTYTASTNGSAGNAGGNDQYQYDLNHNRQVRRTAVNDDSYSYQPGTNRLSVTQELLDQASLLPTGSEQRSYNNANRWYQLFKNGELKATYIYNAQGLRTRKVIGSDPQTATITIYHYDMYGQLIAETSPTGTPQKEYLYNGTTPVAQIDTANNIEAINYIHTDHLYTPRFATNVANDITWRWEGDGFGGDQAQELGAQINLRFAGQYFDNETNLHYNWMRHYDPNTGRYTQSDHIGLGDGTNTYGYVHQNPIVKIDPTGELAWGVFFSAANLAYQLYQNGGNLKCVNWTDVGLSALGGGLLGGVAKGAFRFKATGSHTWGATRAWMNRNNIMNIKSGENRHHWLFERNQGVGKYVPDFIKNQPWNVNPISAKYNNWLGRKPWRAPLGAPTWAKEVAAGAGVAAASSSGGCGCE